MSGASPPASAPVTRASAVKILASVVVVAGAVAYLLTSSMKEGAQFYRHVDEVMANPNACHGKRLQVHGNVVDGSIEQAKGTLLYRFKIESRPPRPPAVITATYNGLVPDTFKGGAEVVASGTLTPDNQLAIVPDGIMAKCPSKYDADKAAPPTPISPGVAQKL